MNRAGRCFRCYRPVANCFCEAIPRIDNQTEVLILQHRRERFHRFNTARIVQQALSNSRLLADNIDRLRACLQLRPRAGLLYPGPSSRLISDLQPDERPEQLVVLDGTWHHAKTLLRDIPVLRTLPSYQLAPTAPSRYRIRREPSDAALSTLEAAVAALRILEPETAGLNLLLQAFDKMVEDQLAHPGSANGQRYRERFGRPHAPAVKNIPTALIQHLNQIVVAYGETAPGGRDRRLESAPPLVWVAERLATGETFSCLVSPPENLDDVHLGHLELTRADFANATTLDEARRRWQNFQQPGDIVAVFHPGSERLLRFFAAESTPCLVLKSVRIERPEPQRTLDETIAAENISAPSPKTPGRAGRRLASTVAYVRYLHALAKAE